MLCATCKGIELRSIDRWDGKEKEIIQRYIHRAAEAQLKNAFYNPPVEITASGTLFYVHHLTLNALKDSAGPQNNDLMTKSNNNEGCDFCKIIFDVLKTGDVRDVPYNTGASLRDGDLKGLPEILLCLETRDLTNRDPGYCLKPDQAIDVRLGSSRLQVVALDLPEYIATAMQASTEFSKDCNSASPQGHSRNLETTLAKYWLKSCGESHERCKELKGTNSHLPTRILDISTRDDVESIHLHISEPYEKQPYVTLSHCWGKRQIITTTVENLEAHKQAIPISALSRTFQDAIAVTQSMGFRYLWIDSLCIIQDSPEDWATESEKMHQIYRNAEFCVSAVGAFDGTFGLFPPGTKMPRPCEMNMSFVNGKPIFLTSNKSTTAQGPLFDRAWVLQEQSLSIRSLQFAADGLYWSCRTQGASERMPLGDEWARNRFLEDNEQFDESSMKPEDSEKVEQVGNRERGKAKEVRLLDTWYREIVAQASRRKLTFETDRLMAINGLAKQVIGLPEFKCHYTFGLWEEDLAMGLLWRGTNSSRRRPPQTFSAPSWSWASISGDVGFFGSLERRNSGRHLIREIGFDSKLLEEGRDKDLDTKREHGLLRARGKLKPIKWVPRMWSYYQGTFQSNLEPETSRGGSGVDLDGTFVGRAGLDDARDVPRVDEQVWCWPVLERIVSEEEENLVCLLLKPSHTGSNENEFVRIGEIETRRLDWFEDANMKEFLVV